MVQAKCIEKFRDKQNKIIGYRLQDLNGVCKDISTRELKFAIKNRNISVVNLTLTSDNRLIDSDKQACNNKVAKKDNLKYSFGALELRLALIMYNIVNTHGSAELDVLLSQDNYECSELYNVINDIKQLSKLNDSDIREYLLGTYEQGDRWINHTLEEFLSYKGIDSQLKVSKDITLDNAAIALLRLNFYLFIDGHDYDSDRSDYPAYVNTDKLSEYLGVHVPSDLSNSDIILRELSLSSNVEDFLFAYSFAYRYGEQLDPGILFDNFSHFKLREVSTQDELYELIDSGSDFYLECQGACNILWHLDDEDSTAETREKIFTYLSILDKYFINNNMADCHKLIKKLMPAIKILNDEYYREFERIYRSF